MELKLMRKQDQVLIVHQGTSAISYMTRLKGLMGRTEFKSGEGILFPRCNSVHMWMMKISIDVVFLSKKRDEWKIVGIYSRVKPWKLLPVTCLKANDTLELPAGTIAKFNLKKGETLCIAS